MRFATVGLSLLGLWALVMMGLAILGGYQMYSPIPFFDSWDGIVHFLQRSDLNSFAPWWSQHNEHRLVLSRGLFWLDDRYFSGASLFLIILNYVCVASTIYLFWRIVRRLSGTARADKAQVVIGLFIVAWLSQWMQVENFSWAFQSQFFLAQLLPLCALYSLCLSVMQPQKPWLFCQACILGLLSVGTMANGILALPLMVVYAAWLRQSRLRLFCLAALSGVSGALYFFHYTTPAGHGSLSQAIQSDWLGVIHYVVTYLGNPFYYLVGQRRLGVIVAALSGVVFIGFMLRSAWCLWRQPIKQPLPIALLIYLLYIGATALGTAGGRALFGVEQALSSRYTTPTLMAWLTLALLPWPFWQKLSAVKQRWWGVGVLLLMILMSRQQYKVLHFEPDAVFQKNVAGLALELNIPDMEQIKATYPVRPIHVWPIAQQAFLQQKSFFKLYPFVGLRQQLTQVVSPAKTMLKCQALVGQIVAVPQDDRFLRIKGELSAQSTSSLLRFLNDRQQIIGYALTRPSYFKDHVSSEIAIYQGYVLRGSYSAITLQVLHHDSAVCQVRLPVSL